LALTVYGCGCLMWMYCMMHPFLKPLTYSVLRILFATTSRLTPYDKGGPVAKTELGVAYIGGLEE
jgi:hypothetical protein